ncbi:MAG: XdhC family protein [Vicinamibacterales bacterium]
MSRRETERILAAIRDVRSRGERAALATVVRVRGSAYRREGAQILVRENGGWECLLSGGCLEPAVADAAARVIATGAPVLVPYDLEDDSVWGLGIGCTGAVDVLIERLDDDEVMRAWIDRLERGAPAVLVTPLDGASGRLLVDAAGGTTGRITPVVPGLVDAARRRLAARSPHAGTEGLAGVDLFFAISQPPPSLVLFGAGHDAVPLARGAWDLGYAVTIVDSREAFLTSDRFPGMTRVHASFDRLGDAIALDARSAVVVMNHHLERDRQSLRAALASDARYVGLLGPRSRLHKLVAALRDEGAAPDDAALARVRNPVGLAIGAETPEEIAVSILGELVALDRGFEGGFLAGRESSLHRSDDSRALARS